MSSSQAEDIPASQRVSVVVAIYNEADNVEALLEALDRQSVPPAEVVIVDDGSTDRSPELVENFSASSFALELIRQANSGPALARNRGWRAAQGEIVAFTDGDCVPEPDWLEKLLIPFANHEVGAVGGTYRTLNPDNVLESFIGLEIDYRYKDVADTVNCHGTYNLAVRKRVLEEVGGMSEQYSKPSGEDWDMTYKISSRYNIAFQREASVAAHHPSRLWSYLQIQSRRAYDRIRLYNDFPEQATGDTYTSSLEKYQVLAAIAVIGSPVLLMLSSQLFLLSVGGLMLFMFIATLGRFFYMSNKDLPAALYGIFVQILRNFAWALGMVRGLIDFGGIKIILGVLGRVKA